jgi:hypothetical protein
MSSCNIHSCDELRHKKTKMDTENEEPNPNNVKYNSFQNLTEGKLEVIVSNQEKTNFMNVSELLRDLYNKIYELQAKIDKLTAAAA